MGATAVSRVCETVSCARGGGCVPTKAVASLRLSSKAVPRGLCKFRRAYTALYLNRPFFGPQIKRDREWQHAYFVKIAIFGCLQILFPFFGRVMSQGAAGEKILGFGRHKTLISLTNYIHPGPNITTNYFLRAAGTGAGASFRLPPLGAAAGACLRAFAAEGFGATGGGGGAGGGRAGALLRLLPLKGGGAAAGGGGGSTAEALRLLPATGGGARGHLARHPERPTVMRELGPRVERLNPPLKSTARHRGVAA